MDQARTSAFRDWLTTSFVGLISLFAGAPGAVKAAVIFSDNFESPSTGGDASFTVGTNPTGWTNGAGGALRIMQNPDNQTYTGTTGAAAAIANMVGPQIVSIFADNNGTLGNTNGTASFSQTLGNTLTLGNSYTASISIGRRGVQNSANLSLGYFFELLAGATVIASTSADGSGLTNNTFAVISISHTAVGSDPIGQALTIRFGTNLATQAPAQMATDFDAVSLTESVPEPTAFSLISFGSLIGLRRRRA